MSHPYFDLERPIAIGHRGAAGLAPENTLASFERALELGAAILESDAHLTRDGVVVLLHDDRVDRTTDGAGAVRDLGLAELKRLDAGFRFSPDGGASFPFRGRGLTVPTLEEAFAAFPQARFNIELKEQVPGLVEGAVAAVRAASRADRTLLTSGEDPIMAALRAHLDETGVPVAIGASPADVLGFVRAALEGGARPSNSMALQIPARFGSQRLVTRELVEFAHRHCVQVHVWTVNDPDEMTALLDLGADGIVSDFPDRVAALAAARRAG